MGQVREGGHKQVVFLGFDGGRRRAEFPDEGSYLSVVFRVGVLSGGQEVAGAAEEVGLGVRDAGELAAGHGMAADETQVSLLGFPHDSVLGAGGVGDEGSRGEYLGHQFSHFGDRSGEHYQVRIANFLDG